MYVFYPERELSASEIVRIAEEVEVDDFSYLRKFEPAFINIR